MKPMIDRVARDSLAEHLRQLASGAITNFDFENRRTNTSYDLAIHSIEYQLAWPTYDDFSVHRLDGGYKLTDGQKKDFARAVLFLKSDCVFLWPKKTLAGFIFIYIRRFFSLGTWAPKHVGGDIGVWPFWSREDYNSALSNPPYLKK